ncbi:MAG: carbonic anhydrase [Gemmatimonadetes bacterium RBG_16_66_8]|nr:MAG: carbonic anhydrase [Gemmatimonadetes bacterium RBG_16_66_8]
MLMLPHLFANNREWARKKTASDAEYFRRLSNLQSPEYLWIGCADSRVPANEIIGLEPGEVFVHRNVGNIIPHTDLNCLSVLQYAVEVLRVQHVIVCGHYGCGAVKAAMGNQQYGLLDNWLRALKDLHEEHRRELQSIGSERRRGDRMCELNVARQVANACHTSIVQNAWSRGQALAVHGWIYSLEDGLLGDLGLCVTRPEQLAVVYRVGGTGKDESRAD